MDEQMDNVTRIIHQNQNCCIFKSSRIICLAQIIQRIIRLLSENGQFLVKSRELALH